MNETFYENEKQAIQEFVGQLGSETDRYTRSIQNYKTLVESEKCEKETETRRFEAETKRMEAENRKAELEVKKIEAEARRIEAENRSKDAQNRVISTIIETSGKILISVATSYLGYKSLILIANYEIDGTMSNKLVSAANRLIIRA